MKYEPTIYNLQSTTSTKGVASLSAILLIGAIIVDIALVGMFIVFIANNTNYGFRLSAQAYANAGSGIEDATLRVVRGMYTANTEYNVPDGATYIICDESSLCTDEIICNGSGSCTPGAGKREIVSRGQALTKNRSIRATLDVDAITGAVSIVDIREISI